MSERYGTIIADPPWAYQQWSEVKHGSANKAYTTSSTDGICALAPAVDDLADDDCVLLMWCTWPKLPDGVAVMAAWGFEYVTGFPWVKTGSVVEPDGSMFVTDAIRVKPRRGVGFWTMGCTEFVMVGRRGKVRVGRTKKLGIMTGDPAVFWGPSAKHSQKPDDLHAYAEDFLPGPYLELFARRPVDGWRCVGSDLGELITPEGVKRCGNEI